MNSKIIGISSMATREVLGELAAAFERRSGRVVAFESVGGVDAAKRVGSGEPYDVVVLASDAIDKLLGAGRIVAGSKVDLARSGVAVAVRSGAPRPEIGSEEAVRRAVLSARSVGCSTGPSGVALAGFSNAGASPPRSKTGSSTRRPACPSALWWPAARSSSASSS